MRGATVPPLSKSPQGDALEEEQRFYIQQLFRRYGQKDRLDFQGFQSLLFSLGLGEVKVVGVDHNDLGHDHVAHLDLLDMQEGLHSHSDTDEGHSHHHGHGHSHHKPGSPHEHTEGVPTRCSQTTVASPAAGAPTKQAHDHDHDHDHDLDHDHEHNHDHVHNDGHDHDHVHNDGLDHGHVHNDEHEHGLNHDHVHSDGHDSDHKQVEVQALDMSSQPHNDHNHSDHDSSHTHQVQTGTEIAPIKQEQMPTAHLEPSKAPQKLQSSPSPAQSRPKKPRKPSKIRGLHGRTSLPPSASPSEEHDHKHDHSHDHDHRHGQGNYHKDKREAPGGDATPTLSGPVQSGHAGGLSHQHEEVGNLSWIISIISMTASIIGQTHLIIIKITVLLCC